MAISQNPALLWELIFGRSSVGKSTILLKYQFHRFLLWLFIFLSYSESSRFGRPGLERICNSFQKSISQIPSLTADISFLLWELHIWLTKCWQINPPSVKWQFNRFLLWMLIFLFYSKSSTFGRPGLGRSLPSQMASSQIPALLWELIFGRPSVSRSILPP